MQEELRDWLVQSGFPEETEVRPMQAGLGGTTLWSFSSAPDAAPLVARVFAPGHHRDAEREALAMRAATERSVPVPAVVLLGRMDAWPVLVTTMATGRLASDALTASPEQAHAIGVAMGETLGRLHAIVAPTELATRADAWIARGGPSLAPLRERFARLADQDRLLHLDYHPNNIFTEGEQVTAIIDWENTLAGPPHMDVARTRAIFAALRLGNMVAGGAASALTALEAGLVEGHARVVGADPHPALSAAWGMAMTADDLAAHLGKPDSWVTAALIDALRAERDRRIADALPNDTP